MINSDRGARESPSSTRFPDTPELAPHASASILNSLRWLAELCGIAPPGTPMPALASEALKLPALTEQADEYISWWLMHADSGSTFEKITHSLPDMPRASLVSLLENMGYDGLLFFDEGKIAGHVFFQRHEGDLCAFSLAVGEKFRGSRLWETYAADCVAYAAQLQGVTRIRMGGGNHPITRRLVALLKPHAPGLGWRVSDDGWVIFPGDKNT